MYCATCGSKVPDAARFCPQCGAGLAGAPAPSKVITGTARADAVTGGNVAGVRVERVAAERAEFRADVIQVTLSDAQAAQLARVADLPTELTPQGHLVADVRGLAHDVAAMRESLDAALQQLVAGGDQGRAGLKVGSIEMSRVELLVKKGILLETEGHQLVFDQAARYRERLDRRGITTGKVEVDLVDIMGNLDLDAYHGKLREAATLFREASGLDPANTEALLHLAQVLMLVGDDEAEVRKVLYRVQQLIGHPKNEAERFHLAQAMFLSATAVEPVQRQAVQTARAMFQELGRADWVRACDEHLGQTDAVSAQPRQTGATGPVFSPVGHWQVVDGLGNRSVAEYRPDGTFEAVQQAGVFGSNHFAGRWAFDAESSVLQVQGMINRMVPFALAVIIRGEQQGTYLAVDAAGTAYYLTRLST